MHLWYRLLLTLAIGCTAAFCAASGAQDYRSGQLLVKFKPGTRGVDRIHAAIGASVAEVVPHIGTQVIRLPAGISVEEAIVYYRNRQDVAYAEPDYIREASSLPNDPLYGSQYAPSKIFADTGWDITTGASTVIIAVVDTGVDLQHEDLKNKLVPGYDISDNDFDTTAAGDHGVHTAGIAGAETNNLKGIAGIGYNCKIMPLKIFPRANSSTSATAIIYAADHGAKVVSMSYGGTAFSSTEQDAVDYAVDRGLVLVAAAGNAGINQKNYPAAYLNVIAVGSTGPTDVRSSFTNFGDWVSVAAPGENIVSTVTGGYATLSGTSMSCPHVAGMAALLFSFAGATTQAIDIRNAIEQTTDPVGNWLAHGRINVRRGLDLFVPGPLIQSSAVAVASYVGTNPSGTVSSVTASDADSYTITSVADPIGQAAGVVVTLSVPQPVNKLRNAHLTIEENGPVRATNQLFFWNFSANRYDLRRSTALSPSGTHHLVLPMPTNLSAYVQNGQMKVLTRAIWIRHPYGGTPAQPVPFQLSVNLLELWTQS